MREFCPVLLDANTFAAARAAFGPVDFDIVVFLTRLSGSVITLGEKSPTFRTGQSLGLPRHRPDYSGTQSGKAFKPTAEAKSFLPFFRVMNGLKMSL